MSSSNPEKLLISSVILTKDHITASSKGITNKFFHSYPDEWAWVERYIARHRRTPSKAAFKNKFPGFKIVDADDVAHFSEEVRKAHATATLSSTIEDILTDIEDGQVEDAVKKMHSRALQIESAMVGQSHDADIITSPNDVLDEVMRRIARQDDLGQAGMPTGFPTLDERTGGPQPGQVWIVAARLGQGKALANYTKVLTPDGWINIDWLEIGDKVVGSDGRPTEVIGVYPQGEKQIWRVHFSDGSYVDTCKDHLWNVRVGNKPWRVQTTEQIKRRGNSGQRYAIPTVAPVHFSERTIPYNAYKLGLLLGDGCFSGKGISFSTADPELVAPFGRNAKHYSGYDYGISNLVGRIKSLGLHGKKSHEKFIPEDYLFASIKNRHALLQGLLDTDGSPTATGGVEFSTTSRDLAAGVQWLAESLGGHAHWHERYTSCNGKRGRLSFRLIVALPPEFPPFRLKRKADLWKPRTKYLPTRTITEVEILNESIEMTCIAVDAPDSLFVTEHGIVTHNTWSLARMACAAAFSGFNIQYDALEGTRPEIAMRIHTFASSEYGKEVFKNIDLATGQNFSPRAYKEFLHDLRNDVKGRMHIADTTKGAISPLSIAAQIERNRVDAVYLDYITLMEGSQDGEDDWKSIGKLSKNLKQVAQMYQCPIIAAAQLNRTAASMRDPAGPETLAESDAIGRDADAVITLKQLSKHVIAMKLVKFRHGRDGYTWYNKFLPNTGHFEEITFDEAQDVIADDKDDEIEDQPTFKPRQKGSYKAVSDKKHKTATINGKKVRVATRGGDSYTVTDKRKNASSASTKRVVRKKR